MAAGAFFGLAPFLAPAQFASNAGFAGQDVFMYRLAGAATFAYAVGLAVGFQANWEGLRIPIAATATFNVASIAACVAAMLAGSPQPVVYLILVASILFTAATLYFLARPPPSRVTAQGPVRTMAPWIAALFAIGVVAAAFFGLAALIAAGAFGQFVGYSGTDDFVYRQGGAATTGTALGGLLVLFSRRWEAARLPAVMALAFNGLSVVAAILDIADDRGKPSQPHFAGSGGRAPI